MTRCGTAAYGDGRSRTPGKAQAARCGAVEPAMKGTERGRKREFALHVATIRYIIAILCFIALLHAMATSSSIDARLSRADAFAAEHGLAWTPLRRQVYERVLAAQRPIGAYDLLAEEKLLIVQGTGFNWPTPDHFRLVFLPNADDLHEALVRIERFLGGYRKRHAG